MPGRKFTAANGYRYGFNGKENDKDAGEGIQDYGMRIYDARIGRFLSVDPLTIDYPWYAPYQFAGNMPIHCVDLDGKEPKASVIVKNNFEKDGSIYKLTKTEMKSVWPIQYSHQVTISGKTYNANSAITTFGRDDSPNRKEGNFTGVTEISKESIATLMAYGLDIIQKGGGQITDVFKGESGTKQKLDFKYKAYEVLKIPENNLLNINGTLYNANEAGNYLWGMLYEYAGEATDFKGGWLNPALAADWVTIRGQKRLDEGHEQYAIKAGQKQGDAYADDKEFNKRVKAKISNETKAKFTGDTE